MKSGEQAQRTYKNPCNTSTSKFQYSFGKDPRFKHRRLHHHPDTYYNLPSEISKKGGTIGRAKRDCQKSDNKIGPDPGSYTPQDRPSEPAIGFAAGRDKCVHSSVFYNTTISYPGPGNYNPKNAERSKSCHMAHKVPVSYQTISPGPKYNFQSTLLDRNKILSNLKRSPGTRICLPSQNHSRVSHTEVSESNSTINNSYLEGYISNKGKKSIGKSGRGAIIGNQKRFRPASAKLMTPGPGCYSVFSDFIEMAKK